MGRLAPWGHLRVRSHDPSPFSPILPCPCRPRNTQTGRYINIYVYFATTLFKELVSQSQAGVRPPASPQAAAGRREEGGVARAERHGSARGREGSQLPSAGGETGPRGNGGSAGRGGQQGTPCRRAFTRGRRCLGRVALANRQARSGSVPPPPRLPQQPTGRLGCHFGSRPPASRPRPFPSRATGQLGHRPALSPHLPLVAAGGRGAVIGGPARRGGTRRPGGLAD